MSNDSTVKAITLMNGDIVEKTEGQFFQLSESEKSWELWEGGNFSRFIKRFRRSSVAWIHEDKLSNHDIMESNGVITIN